MYQLLEAIYWYHGADPGFFYLQAVSYAPRGGNSLLSFRRKAHLSFSLNAEEPPSSVRIEPVTTDTKAKHAFVSVVRFD